MEWSISPSISLRKCFNFTAKKNKNWHTYPSLSMGYTPSASLQLHQTFSSRLTPGDPMGGITFSVSVRARRTRGLFHQWQVFLLCPYGRSLLKGWHTPSDLCSSAAAKAGCVPAEFYLGFKRQIDFCTSCGLPHWKPVMRVQIAQTYEETEAR